jgi:hypothetical protein
MNDELKIGYTLTVAVASLLPASVMGVPSGIPSSEIGVGAWLKVSACRSLTKKM